MSEQYIAATLMCLPVIAYFTFIWFNPSVGRHMGAVVIVAIEVLSAKSAQISFLLCVISSMQMERLGAGK